MQRLCTHGHGKRSDTGDLVGSLPTCQVRTAYLCLVHGLSRLPSPISLLDGVLVGGMARLGTCYPH
jgi:hypothetical protein